MWDGREGADEGGSSTFQHRRIHDVEKPERCVLSWMMVRFGSSIRRTSSITAFGRVKRETAFLESCSYVKVCFDEPASVVGVEVRFGYSRGWMIVCIGERVFWCVRGRKKRKLAWNRSRR